MVARARARSLSSVTAGLAAQQSRCLRASRLLPPLPPVLLLLLLLLLLLPPLPPPLLLLLLLPSPPPPPPPPLRPGRQHVARLPPRALRWRTEHIAESRVTTQAGHRDGTIVSV